MTSNVSRWVTANNHTATIRIVYTDHRSVTSRPYSGFSPRASVVIGYRDRYSLSDSCYIRALYSARTSCHLLRTSTEPSKVIWALAVAYGLVGLGLLYSLAVDSSELFLAMTTVIYVLMLPLAYLVYKKRVVSE